MKITIQDGKGKPINPYISHREFINNSGNGVNIYENERHNKFEAENPPLIVLDQNGLEYKEPGEYEAEKVRQYWGGIFPDDKHWINRPNFTDIYLDNDERFVYQLSQTRTLEGEQMDDVRQIAKDKFISEVINNNDPEFLASFDTLEEVYDAGKLHWYQEGAKFGAQWHAKNSGLISKDAVTDIITKHFRNDMVFIGELLDKIKVL